MRLQGVHTESSSWDLSEEGTELWQLLKRDLAFFDQPRGEGHKSGKIASLLLKNHRQDWLEEGEGDFQRADVYFLAD